jgi:hypothetical protein
MDEWDAIVLSIIHESIHPTIRVIRFPRWFFSAIGLIFARER